ncbi:MAG TPA: PGF-CTERM sorting domain-containing protein [Desulfobacteria bacterium]|nr:PGF-CTERM sorting domain-containing protein [Desulfobacteria bacterium]
MKTKIIGITLAVIMLASIFGAMVPSTLATVKPATQVMTSYNQTFTVNLDHVTLWLDGQASAVVVGQLIVFNKDGGADVAQVTLTGVEGTDTEGEVVFSDNTGKLDTTGLERGPYDATADGATATRINIGTARGELDLRDTADTKTISSVTQGSPFRVKFTHSLDGNDGVSLKVSGPADYKQNPADKKVFEKINVSSITGDNAIIDTDGWSLGTYTIYIKTDEQYARGLALSTNEKEITVMSGKIAIAADTTEVTKGSKVKITVTGVAGDTIKVTADEGEFPVGENDNPNTAVANNFEHTIDSDGVRAYIVKFVDTGSKKVKVEVIAGNQVGKDASVTITVKKKTVTFDVPSTAIIGEEVTIAGAISSGTDVDIVIEDAEKVFDDEPVDENKEFSVKWDTSKLTKGSYKIEVFITSDIDTEDPVSYKGEDEDGSITIRLTTGELTAEQARNVIAEDDDYTLKGTATGVDNVDIVLIGPKGSKGGAIDDVKKGLLITDASVTDDEFSEDIGMDEGLDTGTWIALVLTPGRDAVYGDLTDKVGDPLDAGKLKTADLDFTGKDQSQILAIINDRTVSVAGSDDIMEPLSFKVESGYVRFDPIESVGVGDPLNITGKTNREPDTTITISTFAGPTDLPAAISKVAWETKDNGVFSATIDTTDAKEGTYTLQADDGDGNTDTVTVTIGAAAPATPAPTTAPTTAPTAAPTAPPPVTTPTPTAAPTAAPTTTPEEPGFEAVFAIAGLLAVAYLVLRIKK